MKKSVLIFLLLIIIVPFVSSADNKISFSKNHIQLGDNFTITGESVKLDSNLFTGNAMIVLDNGMEKYTLLAHIVDGFFQQDVAFCSSGCVLPSKPGNYTTTVSLMDASLMELQKIGLDSTLIVDSKYNIIVELNKMQINPGDKVLVEGSVQRNSDSSLLDKGNVKIMFDSTEYKTSLINQKFSYEFSIPFDIKSNYHTLQLSIVDEHGNVGENSAQFFVVAVPTSLTISTEKDSYLPEELVKISVGLVDQAGDEVAQETQLKIYSPRSKKILDELMVSNQDYTFALSKNSEPGDWRIVVKSENLRNEKMFTIETVKKIDVSVNGQYLDVVNVGNVDYEDNLIIFVDTDNFSSQRRTSLNPGEIISLKLNSLLDEGPHKITIENTGQSFDVEVVDNRGIGEKIGDFFSSVTGQAVKKSGTGTSNTPTVIMVLLFLFIILMGYSGYRRYKAKNINRIKFKEPKIPKEDNEELAVVKKADVVDIRDRILRNLKESKKSKKEEKVKEDTISLKLKPVKEEKPSKVDFDQPMRKKFNEESGEDGWTYF